MDVKNIVQIFKVVHIVKKINIIIVEKLNVVIQVHILLIVIMFHNLVKIKILIIHNAKYGHIIQLQILINVVNVLKIII